MPFNLRIPHASALIAALMLGACAHEAPVASATLMCDFPEDGTQSHDILCREPLANQATVKHILVSWKGAAPTVDPRAEGRTRAEAQALARDLLRQLRGGSEIEPLMEQYSEDPGSAKTGSPFEVSPSASLVSSFKSLSLRLQVGEAGVVESPFGLHVIQRFK